MTGTGQTDSRQPLPIDTGKGLTVFYKDRWLYSRREPAKNPLSAALSLPLLDETLVLCCSPLLGYGLKELLARLPLRCAVLAVETDEELMALSVGYAAPEVLSDERLRYVRTSSVTRILETVDTLKGAPFRRVVRLDLSGGASLYPSFYDETAGRLTGYVARWWKNRVTLIRLGRNYSRNLLTNLGLVSRSRPCTLPRHMPVFLAAAGPSLDHAIPIIRRYRERIFLAAVDTAGRTLMDSGIRPDLLILVESQFWISEAFIGLRDSRIPVLADLTARTEALLAPGGTLSFFLSEYAKTRYIPRLCRSLSAPLIVPPLGSVGLTALALLSRLRDSSQPLFFAGLDFSWTGGFTHARHAPAPLRLYREHDRLRSLQTRGLPGSSPVTKALGIEGEVLSDPLLASYAELGEELRLHLEEEGAAPVYDLGGSGLPMGFTSVDRTLMESLLNVAASQGALSSGAPPDADALSGKDARAFLEGELELLSKLESLLSCQGEIGEGRQETAELMDSLDYLWLHFPDAHRGEKETPEFRSRVYASIGYYRKSILRALNFLSS